MIQGGYPAEADIDSFLAARGIELVTENNANFILEFKKFLYSVLNSLDWASPLGVYCPSPTTFNTRGGYYLWKGQVKTYSPGSAVDPTDNDTTYIWLNADNTIASGIDGSGWPSAEHIKLAEIDVDSGGVITEIRDLRGQTFLNYNGNCLTALATVTGVDLNGAGGTETGLYLVPTGKKFLADGVRIRDLSGDAANAVVTFGKTGGDCDEFLDDQTLSNLDGTTKTTIVRPVPSATPPAQIEFAAGETFGVEITTPAGSACTCVMEPLGRLVDA